jgi:hypothetical protein
MSAQSDVVAAVVSSLSALADGNVNRGWPWPMPEEVDEQIWVRPEQSIPEQVSIGNGPVDWRTTVSIQVRVRFSPDVEGADEAVDDLLTAVYAALAGISGAGIQDVIPGSDIAWDYTGADVNIAAVSITAEVLHRTEAATLTTWA